MTREFKPAEFHVLCYEDKLLSPQQNFFVKIRKNRHVIRGKLLLQHVAASCARNILWYNWTTAAFAIWIKLIIVISLLYKDFSETLAGKN